MTEETVTRTITIELPKNLDDFFEGLAVFAKTTVEEILQDALLTDVRCWKNGMLEPWIEKAFEVRGITTEMGSG